MSNFHSAYHLVSQIMAYVWGLVAGIVVWVILPILALGFLFTVTSVITTINKRKGENING